MGRKKSRSKKQELAMSRLPVQPYKPHLPQSLLKINEQAFHKSSGKCETVCSHQETVDFTCESADSLQKTLNFKCDTADCQQETEVVTCETTIRQKVTSIVKCETVYNQQKIGIGKCEIASGQQETTNVRDFNSKGSSKLLLDSDTDFPDSSVCSSAKDTCHRDSKMVKRRGGSKKTPSSQNGTLHTVANKGKRVCAKSDEKKVQAHSYPCLPSQVERNIEHLLNENAGGICVEKFCSSYMQRFGSSLIPLDYGYTDVIDLLQAISDIVSMKYDGSESQVLLLPKTDKDGANLVNRSTSRHLDTVIATFQSVLKEHQGGIMLDDLIPEYEMRTGKKFEISELGFRSIPDLLSHLTDVFKVFQRGGQQFVLCDPAITDLQLSRGCQGWKVQDSSRDFESQRTLNQEVIARLKILLEEEFLGGLAVGELIGAYRGFFGATLEDLNHESYGYQTLEALLSAHPEVVSVQYREGGVIIQANHPLFPLHLDQVQPSWPLNVADVGDSYQRLDVSTLMPVEKMVDVVIGEVYTPHRFWVIHRGNHTSQSLNDLMDCMFEFYSSRLGDRFLVPQERIAIGAPVVALYAEDMNFYRALITSLEDLRTVKLFFVDYGTICRCDCASLRLIHKRFFSLPAQAIKAALNDVIPPEGRRFWSRAASQSFLQMVQNKGLVAHIILSKETTHMSLWDTTGEKDISIGEALILQGWAVPSCSPPTEELEKPGSSCYSSFVHTRCSSPKRQIVESISLVDNNENFDNPSKTNAESPSVPLILDSVTQTIHPMRTVAEKVTESHYVFPKSQSVTPVKMVDSKTYSQSSFSESCNNHMVNPNLVEERNKSYLNSTHEFNLVTTASGFEAGNMHQPVSQVFPFELEALKQRLYEDYHLVDTALKYIKSPFSEEFPYLDLTSRKPLTFTQALSSSYPVATASALSSVDNRHYLDRSFPILASSVSDKVISCQSNEVNENNAEVSSNLKVPERLNLFDESPLQNQKAPQDLQLLSRNFAQVTDVERICSVAISPPPGFGPALTNVQSLELPPGFQAYSANLKTIDPSPRFGTLHPIFQNVDGSPSSEPLSADPKILSNPPQFASSSSLNFQVTDPLPGIGSLLDKDQATTSSGFLTNVTKVFAHPIMCTGVKDEIFYSDEEDEVAVQHFISPEKHYYYDCMVRPVVLTAGNTLHVLVLDGTAFILSVEISCLLWHADVLESLLHQKGRSLPKIELEKGTNANVIIQLIESGVNAVYDDNGKILPSLTAYPLKTVPHILQIFSCDDSVLLSAVKNLIYEYSKEDPVQVHSEIETSENNNPASKMHLFTPGIPSNTSYCKIKNPSNPCVLDKKPDDCSNMCEDEILVKKHSPKVETFELNENHSQCLKFSNSNEEHDCYPAVMNDKVCSSTKKETSWNNYLQEQKSEKPPSKPPLAPKPLTIPSSDSRSMIGPSHHPKSVTKPPSDFKHLQKSQDPNPSPEVSDFKHLVKPQDPGPSIEDSRNPKPLTTSSYDHKSFIKPSVAPEPLIKPSRDPKPLTKHSCDLREVTKPLLDSKSLIISPHGTRSLAKSPTGPKSLITPAPDESLCKPVHYPKPLAKPPHNCKTDDRCYDSESLIMDPHDFNLLAKSSCDVEPLPKPSLKPKPLTKLHAQPPHEPTLLHRLRSPHHLEPLTKPICSSKPLPKCLCDTKSLSDSPHDLKLLTKPPCDSRSLSDAPNHEPLTKPPLAPKSVTKPHNDLMSVTNPFNDPKLVSNSLADPNPLPEHHDCDSLTRPHDDLKPLTKPFDHKPVTDSSLQDPEPLNKSPCDLNPLNKPPLNLKQLSKSSDDPEQKIRSFTFEPETDLTVHDPKSLNKPSHDPNSLEKPLLNSKPISESADDPELNMISFALKAETDLSFHDFMPMNTLPHNSKQLTESVPDPKLLTKPHDDPEPVTKPIDHNHKPLTDFSFHDPKPLNKHPLNPKPISNSPHDPKLLPKPKPFCDQNKLTDSSDDRKPLIPLLYDKKPLSNCSSDLKPLSDLSHDPKLLTKPFSDPHQLNNPLRDSEPSIKPCNHEPLVKPLYDHKSFSDPFHDVKPFDKPYCDPWPLMHSQHDPKLVTKSSDNLKPCVRPQEAKTFTKSPQAIDSFMRSPPDSISHNFESTKSKVAQNWSKTIETHEEGINLTDTLDIHASPEDTKDMMMLSENEKYDGAIPRRVSTGNCREYRVMKSQDKKSGADMFLYLSHHPKDTVNFLTDETRNLPSGKSAISKLNWETSAKKKTTGRYVESFWRRSDTEDSPVCQFSSCMKCRNSDAKNLSSPQSKLDKCTTQDRLNSLKTSLYDSQELEDGSKMQPINESSSHDSEVTLVPHCTSVLHGSGESLSSNHLELLQLEMRILKGILSFKIKFVELLRVRASDGGNFCENQLTDQINQLYESIRETERKFEAIAEKPGLL